LGIQVSLFDTKDFIKAKLCEIDTKDFIMEVVISLKKGEMKEEENLHLCSVCDSRLKFIVKKSKCAGLAQEIGFSAPNLCSLPPLVKGATQLRTS
jgi:hypothetical protein